MTLSHLTGEEDAVAARRGLGIVVLFLLFRIQRNVQSF